MQSSSRRCSPTQSSVNHQSNVTFISFFFLSPQIRLSTAKNGRYRGPFQICDSALSAVWIPASPRWFIATSRAVTCKKNHPKADGSRRKFKLTTKVICCWYGTKVARLKCRWVYECTAVASNAFYCSLLFFSEQLMIAKFSKTIFLLVIFAVLRLGWRRNFRVFAGERSKFQCNLRLLHENVALPKRRRDTHHSRGNSR